MPKHHAKKNDAQPEKFRGAYERLEQVIGCKWSVSVLEAVRSGVNRPGALEKHIAGISTKVLSERLRRLTEYGLLSKKSYAEIPPRTEYALTTDGATLVDVIARIHELDAAIAARSAERPERTERTKRARPPGSGTNHTAGKKPKTGAWDETIWP